MVFDVRFVFFSSMLRIKFQAFYNLGKHYAIELHLQS